MRPSRTAIDAQDLAREAAAELFAGTVAVLEAFTPLLEQAVGELPNPLRLNLAFESIFLGVAHCYLRAQKLYTPSQAVALGGFLRETLISHITTFLFTSAAPGQPSSELTSDVTNYYDHWSNVRREQYVRSRRNLLLRFNGLIFGRYHFDETFLLAVLESRFKEQSITPPRPALQAFAAQFVRDFHTAVARSLVLSR
jgi:hypothetical protein